MAHISDDLPLLLTGDATRDTVLQAATHLRTCVDCQQELVSAVIAHASLTSAHRFAPEIVSPEASQTSRSSDERSDSAGADVPALPDLSTLFAEVRADGPRARLADAINPSEPGKARRRLIAVAAAAVIVGGGITAYSLAGNNDDSSRTTQTVALASSGTETGSVRLVGDNRMIVDTKLPDPAGGQQYEVWLTGSDNGRQALGYLTRGGAQITVPSGVMAKYKGIAVSLQGNGQTEFSGKVVLAGRYG